jgi:hypothetical protein
MSLIDRGSQFRRLITCYIVRARHNFGEKIFLAPPQLSFLSPLQHHISASQWLRYFCLHLKHLARDSQPSELNKILVNAALADKLLSNHRCTFLVYISTVAKRVQLKPCSAASFPATLPGRKSPQRSEVAHKQKQINGASTDGYKG